MVTGQPVDCWPCVARVQKKTKGRDSAYEPECGDGSDRQQVSGLGRRVNVGLQPGWTKQVAAKNEHNARRSLEHRIG